jgi:DNA-binding NarL/FixJ family response regulator
MNDARYPIEIALVDDQDLFRSGIRMLVESQSDMKVVSEAQDGEQAVDLAAEHQPHIILMDLRMPVLDGVEATLPKIVALTTFNRDQAVIEAVQAGASGYLLKSAEPEFLLAAIRTVYAGYAVIAPGSVADLFQHARRFSKLTKPDLSAIEGLSGREQELFVLAAKGLSNAEIAGQLFVSEATVKSHIRSILSKLGLQTRIQLVAFAYEHGLIG